MAHLDWLLDHRAEFALLAMKRLGSDIQERLDWTGPRLICIASEFTRYDEHAVGQINRNIELLRYRTFGTDMLLLELVNVASTPTDSGAGTPKSPAVYKGVAEKIDEASPDLANLYQALDAFLVALGDVVVKKTKQYVAYRRIKNFACVEVHPQANRLLAFVKVNPDSVALEAGFTRDVRKIGHFGTGDLEIVIDSIDDLERAKPLLISSYEHS